MTDIQIISKAALFAQYKDAKEVTLRGQGIIDFVRSLSTEELQSLHDIATKAAWLEVSLKDPLLRLD